MTSLAPVEIKGSLEETLNAYEPFQRIDALHEEIVAMKARVSVLPEKASNAGVHGVVADCERAVKHCDAIAATVKDRRAAIIARVVDAFTRERR